MKAPGVGTRMGLQVNEHEAERYLLSLELFGMRFGLDRMRRLMTALGRPERRFESIHVVGTNGKSSTVRMIAAILAHHGLRTGRVPVTAPGLVLRADPDRRPRSRAGRLRGRRLARRARCRARRSCERGDDTVTQFEALTAAAYSELARQGVEVAVIEAGLGGRYDATNVIPSKVQVLTSVGLEHTRWLGPTLADIAGEKLDVVQPGATLVLGAGLADEVTAVAERVAAERDADDRRHGDRPRRRGRCSRATSRRRNFALARTAAAGVSRPARRARGRRGGRRGPRPGRLQQIGSEPLTLVDGAHNPDGMRALVESLHPPLVAENEPIVATVSILDDKDAAGMLSALLPVVRRGRVHDQPQPARAASRDAPVARHPARRPTVGDRPRPRASAGLARVKLAGRSGAVIAAGSIYLVADLLSPARSRRASML